MHYADLKLVYTSFLLLIEIVIFFYKTNDYFYNKDTGKYIIVEKQVVWNKFNEKDLSPFNIKLAGRENEYLT